MGITVNDKWELAPLAGGGLHALLDYNGGPGERKSLADPVFDETFEGEVKFLYLIGKHHKGRRIHSDLRNVTDLHIRR